MTATKKSRPLVAQETGQAETAAFSGAVISCNHSITDGAERQPGFIENLLLYGPENGQTLRDLVHITQWPERAIRKEIEVERRAGALIMSDNRSGYFLTDDPAEAQRFDFVNISIMIWEWLRTMTALSRRSPSYAQPARRRMTCECWRRKGLLSF